MGGPRTAARGSPCLPQLERGRAQRWGPNTAKNLKKLKNKNN